MSGEAVARASGRAEIEALAARLGDGEFDLDTALRRAAAIGRAGGADADDIVELGRDAHRSMFVGRWADAVRLSMLLRAVAGAATPGSALAATGDTLRDDWLDIASFALSYVPDSRLYADALATAEAMLADARARGDRQRQGRVLHSLGTLHLDPWFARTNSERFHGDHVHWYALAESGTGWDGRRYRPCTPVPIPPVEEALARAVRHYREALDFRSGSELGRTLSALAQALQWQERLDGEDRDDEVRVALERAVHAFDPESDTSPLVQAFYYLSRLRVAEIPPTIERLLATPVESLVRTHGPARAMDMHRRLADALTTVDPARALVRVREVAPLFEVHADEEERAQWLQFQARALVAAWAPGARRDAAPIPVASDDPYPVRATLMATLERAEAESWDERAIAAEFVRLARRSTASDEEPLGVAMLDRAEEAAPLSLAPFRDAIAELRCALLVNVGALAFGAGDLTAAVTHYARGLEVALALELPSLAGRILGRLEDVAGEGGAEGARAVVATLVRQAMRIQSQLGEEGIAGVRRVCERALGALPADAADDESRSTLWQVAKGLRFGAILTSGAGHRFARGEREQAVLAQLDIARPKALAEGTDADDAPGVYLGALQNETLLLAPYSRSAILLSGRTARERVVNLELRYESLLDERLGELAGDEGTHILPLADLRDAIDPTMVLLELLEVVDKRGASTLHFAVRTREGEWFATHPFTTSGAATITADDVRISLTRLAEVVRAVRGSVQLAPGDGRDVSEHATEDLAWVASVLLAPVWERLAALRASGKRHLCIVPHGPLHFLPFHLLLVDGKPLAEHWDVSYLPNTRLLLASRGNEGARRHRAKGAAAVGLSFRGTPAHLPEAVPEARDVARLSGGRALLEAQATEAAVLKALRGARMVHLATHGDLLSGAAAFHRLHLSAGGGGDGFLHAHELLGLDARGLELVTLSACHTALGRFDAGDNLRGLAANLFLAGAETIVGTLWELESTAASTFYRAMYRELAADATRFGAFRTALAETRAAHPAWRDWGTFYFAGAWT